MPVPNIQDDKDSLEISFESHLIFPLQILCSSSRVLETVLPNRSLSYLKLL